jgi:UPF0755 protein
MTRRRMALIAVALVLASATVWSASRPGDAVTVVIPSGSTLNDVADSLAAADVVGSPLLFRAYARLVRAERDLKAGTYEMRTGSSWPTALGRLTRGEVVTEALTIPEGFQLAQMAPRIAELTGAPAETVLAALRDEALIERLGVPGPGLEGYLFPDTYRFASGVAVERVIETMGRRYRAIWTPERRARLDASGMTEREAVTLASIVQAEARQVPEMRRIAGVYRNRLDAGWLLQADPTVLYALGGYRARLLYAAIDSVQNHPYNTYGTAGLPPGPIGAPGELAIDAALGPEAHDYMYFVARADGSHVFTRTLAEHNAAKAAAAHERDTARAGG